MKKIQNFCIKKTKFGFTLIELLVALTLLVIISAVIAPTFFANLNKAKDETSLRRAALLDVAKTTFRTDKGNSYAITEWEKAGSDDEAKYTFLKKYLISPPETLGDGTTSGKYASKGYRYYINALTNATTVVRLKDSKTLNP